MRGMAVLGAALEGRCCRRLLAPAAMSASSPSGLESNDIVHHLGIESEKTKGAVTRVVSVCPCGSWTSAAHSSGGADASPPEGQTVMTIQPHSIPRR